MTKLGTTKKAPKKRFRTLNDSPKPLSISHINRLSGASMEALGLSENEVHELSQWWAEYVKRAHLKQQDNRHKDCNFIVVAMEDKGETIFRWKTYHHLTKQDEYFQNGVEAVMKIVYGSKVDELEGLGIDWWDKTEENVT